jgi:hypothetical protein
MGFVKPNIPDLDIEEWKQKPRLAQIKPLAQHWVENGFGTPSAVYILYVLKIAAYAIGGLWVISLTTPHLGGLSHVRHWWFEPIVFEKAVVFTLLFEILGVGCASGPLTLRFIPPIGGPLYWLRPGTMRLAPWPDKVPFTRGTKRTVVDVILYAAILAAAVRLLLTHGTSAGALAVAPIVPLAVLVPLLGLRDKTIFLAARAEQYWVTLLFFFFPLKQMLAAAKIIQCFLWWGAATSKLNKHFPFVVAVMISNSPFRPNGMRRSLYRNYPDDLIPSRRAALAAHLGTVIEYSIPLVLLFSRGGTLTTLALIVIIVFHIHIITTIPMGVPLEWNVFFIFAALTLFGHDAKISPTAVHNPLLILILLATAATVIVGNIKPEWISFLPAMRYYAGNWATSFWCFRKGAEDRFDTSLKKTAPIVRKQLSMLYGDDLAELLQQKAGAWRSLHTHGRALNGLIPRAVDNIADYDVREGEFVAGVALGWNFGDGHLHDEHLLAAIQELCHFAPGDLRVIMLESQAMFSPDQHYRIVDAATGRIEEGDVAVSDMVSRQPWLDETGTIPVHNVKSPTPARA